MTPSQFRCSNVFPSHDPNPGAPSSGWKSNKSRSNVSISSTYTTNTQCLMDNLLDDTDNIEDDGNTTKSTMSRLAGSKENESSQNMDSLIPAFFGQTDSQCLSVLNHLNGDDDGHDFNGDFDGNHLDHSILEEDNELILTQIPASNRSNGAIQNIENMENLEITEITEIDRFPSDIGLSLNEQFGSDANAKGEGVPKEDSLLSNQGSLCEVSLVSHQIGDDLEDEEEELLSVKVKGNGNDIGFGNKQNEWSIPKSPDPSESVPHSMERSLTTLLDSVNAVDSVDAVHSTNYGSNRNGNGQRCDVTLSQFGDSQEVITPIFARRRHKSKDVRRAMVRHDASCS